MIKLLHKIWEINSWSKLGFTYKLNLHYNECIKLTNSDDN